MPEGWDKDLPTFKPDEKGIATREASGQVLNALAEKVSWIVGGAADLAPSTKTKLNFANAGTLTAKTPGGRTMHFGVREHAMGAIVNGMALSKLRAFGSTFLIFSDYMRPTIRLAALMKAPVFHVFTHDSIGVGEDGPTHQPVEQLASLRAIPGLVTLRPADANEVVEAYKVIMQLKDEPAVLILSRQSLPIFDRARFASAQGVARGAYTMADADDGKPQVILIASGSEVRLCVDAYEMLKSRGIGARVVSMPSWDLFEKQDQAYRDSVLPPAIKARVTVEQGSNSWLGSLRRVFRNDDRYAHIRVVSSAEGPAGEVRLRGRQGAGGGSASDRREQNHMNPLKELQQHGQSVWLDFLARKSIAQGELKALVENDGVRGVTSNPAIFEKAIGHGDEYDGPLATLMKSKDRAIGDLYEALAVEDIQHAADVLKPVYDKLDGADGYVSLEVSPYLARDTDATVAEARRLWKAVDRKNLMIKVPATDEGIPAIRTLIGEGINVNITLLFAQAVYADVLEAYMAGLEAYRDRGGDLKRIASVASFFVSRIDSEADKLLDEKIAAANDPTTKTALAALKGKVAIANAKLAYRHYQSVVGSDRWKKLAAQGAQVQRLLWASTGTKNNAYRDTLYVEELIGPDTVNTVPPATLDAFRDHGNVRDSLEENVADADRVLAELKRFGVSA